MSTEPIEHPEDWQMDRGSFPKECSKLGYALLSLADVAQGRNANANELAMFELMRNQLRSLTPTETT